MPTHKKMLFIRSRFEFFRRIQTNEYRTGESNYNIPTVELTIGVHQFPDSVTLFLEMRTSEHFYLVTTTKTLFLDPQWKGYRGLGKKWGVAPVVCNGDSLDFELV